MRETRDWTSFFIANAVLVSIFVSLAWLTSGKTYFLLGFTWIGYHGIGIGFFEGKIFWSSIITFTVSFVVAFYLMMEHRHQSLANSIIVSGLTVLSGAYVFEYVYLYLADQTLLKYSGDFKFWLPLLGGLSVGFSYRLMQLNKISMGFLASFAVVMLVWYFGGYPQLLHKDFAQLVTPYPNYWGLPADWSLPLNSLAKFLACLSVVSLLYRPRARRGPSQI